MTISLWNDCEEHEKLISELIVVWKDTRKKFIAKILM